MNVFTPGEQIEAEKINANFTELANKKSISLDVVFGEQIDAKYPVRFVNEGGTINAKKLLSYNTIFTTPVAFNAVNTEWLHICKAGTSKYFAVYKNASNNYCYGVVGTYANGAVTWGTPVELYAGTCAYPYCEYDSVNDKVLVTYSRNSAGKMRVATISGTSFSLGTEASFYAEGSIVRSVAGFNPVGGYFLVYYYKVSSARSELTIVTIDGTDAASSGTPKELGGNHSSNTLPAKIVYDPGADKFVLMWGIGGTGDRPKIEIVTITDGSPTCNVYTNNYVGNGTILSCDGFYDEASSRVMFVMVENSNNDGVVMGLEVLGEDSYDMDIIGTFSSNCSEVTCGKVDSNYLFFYKNGAAIYMKVGTLSGTTFSFGNEVTLASVNAYYLTAAMSSSYGGVVLAYRDETNSYYGRAMNLRQILLASAMRGLTGEAGAAGEIKKVYLPGGVVSGLTGLTQGALYYMQSDGTIGTTVSGWCVGFAQSTTELVLDKENYSEYVALATPQQKTDASGSWTDWDLSSYLPASARLVCVSAYCSSSSSIGVREKGSTSSPTVSMLSYQTVDFIVHPVGGIVQVYGSNSRMVVTGYWT